MRAALILATLTLTAHAQWTIQQSPTTANLRGIDALGKGLAWASGADGTVLLTEDNGAHWRRCTTPPNAETLDFRGIQAFDNKTAIVMSSGPGDQSRLYKTTDGCNTWKLIFTNPEPKGFFDAIQTETNIVAGMPDPDPDLALVLGDSVEGKIQIWEWQYRGDYCEQALQNPTWDHQHCPVDDAELFYPTKSSADVGEGSFAASNSVFQVVKTQQIDPDWKYEYRFASNTESKAFMSMVLAEKTNCEPCRLVRRRVEVPMSDGTAKSGIYSFAFSTEYVGVAVGGNYEKPATRLKTASFTKDGGNTWKLATTPPHGYRSAVAYDAKTKTWITVGPNGTDISTDDGRNWHPLKPSPTDQPDADQHWNALSLPFAVGPKGRIGLLNPAAPK